MKHTLSIVAVATICFQFISVQASDPIESSGIYKIINKDDKGALTVKSDDSDNATVSIKPFNDSAAQKWKAHQKLLYKSIQLKPTSNDNSELDVDPTTLKLLGKMDASGDARFWYIKDIGEGAYQVKNLQYNTCLTSQGLNKLAVLANCENSAQQQWVFTRL